MLSDLKWGGTVIPWSILAFLLSLWSHMESIGMWHVLGEHHLPCPKVKNVCPASSLSQSSFSGIPLCHQWYISKGKKFLATELLLMWCNLLWIIFLRQQPLSLCDVFWKEVAQLQPCCLEETETTPIKSVALSAILLPDLANKDREHQANENFS